MNVIVQVFFYQRREIRVVEGILGFGLRGAGLLWNRMSIKKRGRKKEKKGR